MGDSAMVVVAIFLAAILMFVFPLMTMADKKDDVSTLTVQTATTEFTDTIRTTGKLTQEKYLDLFMTAISTCHSGIISEKEFDKKKKLIYQASSPDSA